MNPAILLLAAAVLAGCASTKQHDQYLRTQPHAGPGSIDHDGRYRVIDISRSNSLRFFKVLNAVECNQYVYMELPIYDASTMRHNPGRLRTTKNAIEKCGEVFANMFEANDEQVKGADAVLYEPKTFQVTDEPWFNIRPEHAERGDKLGTTSFLSGATGIFVASTGAFLRGWAIAYVDQPAEEDLRVAIQRFWDPSRRPLAGPVVYSERGISRIARRQFEAALAWLHKYGHTQTWDWLAEVRNVLPEGDLSGVDAIVAMGANPAQVAAVNLLAAHGGTRFVDLWVDVLKAAKKSGAVVDGSILMSAGNIVACSTNQRVIDELRKIHSGRRQNLNSAWDLVMTKIFTTYRQKEKNYFREPGVIPYDCPYKPTSFIVHA